MKKIILFGFFMLLFQVLYSVDISDIITRQFFQPYENITKVNGRFDGYYEVQPQDEIPYEDIAFFSMSENSDGIPYEDIAFFSMGKNRLKYYSFSKRTSKSVTNSVIEINNQKFSLGFLYDKGYSARDIMWTEGEFWFIEFNNRKFLCYITHQLGANDPRYKNILLFDITDEQNIQFRIFDTYAFGYRPQIGLYNQTLCILKTDIVGEAGILNTILYSFFDLERIIGNDGKSIELFFSYDKNKSNGSFQILKMETRR